MESKTQKPMTPFDVLTTPSHLYTLKLLLPYTPPSMQHFFAIYIKLQELTYTFQHFHGCKNHSGLPQIFSDLKSYMSPEEQEQMETVENIMNMMTLMQSMPNSAEPDLSDLFSSMFAQETKAEGTRKTKKEMQIMNEWMNHPLMKEIDPLKLELIKKAAAQTNGKTGKALAPVMMTLITSAKKNGIQFTGEEMALILDVLKDGKSKEEQMQIDQMVKMVRHYMK